MQTVGDRPFTVSVVGSAETPLAYGDRIVMAIRITPKAEMSAIGQVDLRPLGNLEAIYPAGPHVCTLSGTSKATQNVPFILSCSLSAGRTFSGDMLSRNAFDLLSDWLLTPGTQKVLLTISANKTQQDLDIEYLEEIPIAFNAPLGVIFTGGLAGAMLLALFSAVKDGAEADVPRRNIDGSAVLVGVAKSLAGWVVNLVPRVRKAILQTIMGGICAVILILLARGTEGLSPPVSIKIQDFWGGVLIGLFSIPLSQWIWTHIRPRDGAQDDNRDHPANP